jgi:hypothetical protein
MSRFSLIRRLAPSPGTFTPSIVDVDGNPITAPLVADNLYGSVGTGTADSYLVQVYDDVIGAIGGTSQTFVSSQPIYSALTADVGHPLRLGFTPVVGGVSGTEVLTAATGNVAMPVLTAPVLARTSATAVAPMTSTITLDATIRQGDIAHWVITNPDDGSLVAETEMEITADQLDGTTDITLDIALPTGNQELQVEVLRPMDDGTPISSGWSNIIAPTDVFYGPELFLNPSFDDTSAWSGGGAVISGGAMHMLGAAQITDQPLTLEIGATYRFICIGHKTGDSGGGQLRLSLNTASGHNADNIKYTSAAIPNGDFTISGNFVSDTTSCYPSIEASAATFSGDLYSVSLRKIL